ncbi:DUF5317 domain-containing protein [Candidatus Acetothermia bacterium]|nr:DUF5317 domain-containing protein [Candidatus Acetothermia bacterium]MBI3643810.1 DUF5317 domain-containing protein [Candidatus Acetothermia bacterium]
MRIRHAFLKLNTIDGMFLLWAIPIGIVVGYLLGGRLKNLNQINLHAPWLIFVALGIQLLIFPIGKGTPIIPFATEYLHIASYLILGIFVLLNWREWGMVAMAIGALSNFVVISANGGFMPTRIETLRFAGLVTADTTLSPGEPFRNNVIMGENAPLGFMGDVFALPAGFPLANVFSIGDVILAIGFIAYLQAKMRS